MSEKLSLCKIWRQLGVHQLGSSLAKICWNIAELIAEDWAYLASYGKPEDEWKMKSLPKILVKVLQLNRSKTITNYWTDFLKRPSLRICLSSKLRKTGRWVKNEVFAKYDDSRQKNEEMPFLKQLPTLSSYRPFFVAGITIGTKY